MTFNQALAIILAILVLGFSPVSVRAQGEVTAATSTIISLGGKQIMNIRTGAKGFTAQQRADNVRDRLVTILSLTHLSAADVRVQGNRHRPKQDASIYIRHRLLITIDAGLAAANHTTQLALAEQWAAALTAILPEVSRP